MTKETDPVKEEVVEQGPAEDGVPETERTFEEAPESKAPVLGVVGFQKLLVDNSVRTPGNGTCEFLAVPVEGLDGEEVPIHFQNGLPGKVGVNGLSNETALRAVLNRLRAFQAGPFACDANSEAIHHITAALSALARRTLDREDRGVESTLDK
jgi:hypothetical protein